MKLPLLPLMPITWLLVNFITYPTPIWANPPRAVNNLLLLQTKQTPQAKPDFSGDGRSGRRSGGGSRSPCLSKEPPLTALSPVTNWGKTVLEHPTFWFYVPYSAQEAPLGEFILQEEQGKDVYRTRFTLPGTPGFVSITLPPTATALEINKSYRWYFKLYCSEQKSSGCIFVEGWVQRVELTPVLDQQLKATSPQNYLVYADNLIWYDAIANLAKLRLQNPSNSTLEQDWDSLLKLKGIALEQLDQEPLVGSVNQL
ncbi:MAG TPA: hypothetical protein DDZ80_11255 [Cyanobacteria bacterium UBA8803]|nr:hypothetical protein [Cyanobacteria bacterium UBA9273]HBL59068.1 hypothetical protein [Cyanobacteria bacterium UBA8803]